MHVKAKTVALGGLLLALTVVFMALGSIIETSTLFLLAASFIFRGHRNPGIRAESRRSFLSGCGSARIITAPNKFYVLTFAAMGFYIWGIEAVWRWLEKRPDMGRRHTVFWLSKYVIFNIMYIPIVFLFRDLLFPEAIPGAGMLAIVVGGQVGLFIYDRAYDYVQVHMWGKIRGRVL